MRREVVLASVLLAMGCSSGGGSSGSSFEISSQPLHGTVGSQPFSAVSAVASPSSDGTTWFVSIFQNAVGCTDPTGYKDASSITLSVPWSEGVAAASTSTFAELEIKTGTSWVRRRLPDARIEIVSAPTEVGSTATIRLRGSSGTDSVEGEVHVAVCGP